MANTTNPEHIRSILGRVMTDIRAHTLAVAILDYFRCLEDRSFWNGNEENRQMIRSRLDDLTTTMKRLAEELA